MTIPKEPSDGSPHLLDTLSRRLATAGSRRDAIRFTFAALFGNAIVASCTGLTEPCGAGCTGSDGVCYTCSSGTFCSGSGGSNCSAASAGGVYCCRSSSGGGGGGAACHCFPGNVYNFSSGKCCANATPYYYAGNNTYGAGCYAVCPYNNCGSAFEHC